MCGLHEQVLELAVLTQDIGYVVCKAGPGTNLTAALGGERQAVVEGQQMPAASEAICQGTVSCKHAHLNA
jgi:hypothetical protein